MASINVSEEDFMVVACAAMEAKRRDDMDAAIALDKIARKINATLSVQGIPNVYGVGKPHTRWRDMPSTLDEIK